MRIERERAGLLIVDIQERLSAVMPQADLEAVLRNVGILVELARRLGLPVVLSEQYTKGLGPTVRPVEDALAAPGVTLRRLEKLEFACDAAPAFAPIWSELRRDQWIVAGMETHVCVYQTVRGLCGRGATVHVPRDAVVSRTAANREVGLSLIERAGGIVTSTETVVFDALHHAGGEDFKALSRMIK